MNTTMLVLLTIFIGCYNFGCSVSTTLSDHDDQADLKLLRNSDFLTRMRAYISVYKCYANTPEEAFAINAIIENLNNSNAQIRSEAINQLFHYESTTSSMIVFDRVMKLLVEDDCEIVRCSAIRNSYEKWHTDSRMKQLYLDRLGVILDHAEFVEFEPNNTYSKRSCLDVLKFVSNCPKIASLMFEKITRIAKLSTPDVVCQALKAIGNAHHVRSIDVLREYLQDTVPIEVRLEAAALLLDAKRDEHFCIEVLIEALKYRNTQCDAVGVLCRYGKLAKGARPIAVKLTQGYDDVSKELGRFLLESIDSEK